MLHGIERLMNELASLWIDACGNSTKMRMGIREDFRNMCPGVIWRWVKDRKGKLTRISVIDFIEKPPVNPGALQPSSEVL